MTFERLFEKYELSRGFVKLSVKSKQTYMYCGKRLAQYFGSLAVDKMKRPDIIKMMNDHADKPAYANLIVRVASVVLSYGVDIGEIQFNPADRVKKYKIGSHTKWTVDEVGAVIAIGDRVISTAVALAWYTGQREGDVLLMRWKDYFGGYIALTQQKTGLEMKIKVHPKLEEYLASIRGNARPDDYIVSGTRKMSEQSFRGFLKRRTKKLNIDKVFHGIRKGVACSLAENGSSISQIAAMLGHKSIRMAAYYAEQADSRILTESAVNGMVAA